jgi:hypothetical protein
MSLCFLIVFTALFFFKNAIQNPVSQADMNAMQWLIDNTKEDDVILNPQNVWIMPFTGRKSLEFGIPPDYEYGEFEDTGVYTRGYLISEFQRIPNDSLAMLQQHNVSYVILNNTTSMQIPDYFQLVFEQDGARVYRVLDE